MKGGPRRAIRRAPKLLIMLVVHERFTCTRISAADICLSRPFRSEKKKRERETRGACSDGEITPAIFLPFLFFHHLRSHAGEKGVRERSAIFDTNISAGFVAVDSK